MLENCNPDRRKDFFMISTSIVSEGSHFKLTFYDQRGKAPTTTFLEGELNPDFGVFEGTWTWTNANSGNYSKFIYRRTSEVASAAPFPTQTLDLPLSLANLAHSLNVQIFDRFKGEQFFNVMEDAKLQQEIPATGQPPNPPYDLNDLTTLTKFRQAGIQYLLVTSVEDYSDQTLEKRRTQGYHFQTAIYSGAIVYERTSTRNAYRDRHNFSSTHNITGSASDAAGVVATQGGFDPEVWQQQSIRLTVRCQLYDATSGELKKSMTATFPFQRDYTAVAQGNNQLSTADLFEAAARRVSDWATILVDDTVFPIKILAKKDQEVTLSRGMEAGLKVGQVFEVCTQGDAINDPDTGKMLGYDVKTIGRVIIVKLEPKFSHAKVTEDNGIIPGANLIRAVN